MASTSSGGVMDTKELIRQREKAAQKIFQAQGNKNLKSAKQQAAQQPDIQALEQRATGAAPTVTAESVAAQRLKDEQAAQANQDALKPQQSLKPVTLTPLVSTDGAFDPLSFAFNAFQKSNFGQAFAAKQALDSSGNGAIIAQQTQQMRQLGLTPEQFSNDPAVQNMLKLGLNEQDLQVLATGEARISEFSQLVEQVPLLNKGARYFGAFGTPTSKIDTTLKTISELDSQISDASTAAATNPGMANHYYEQVNEIEKQLNLYESKIKLLIIQSPELRNNPEEVINIQTKVKGTRDKIPLAKVKILAVQ